MKLRGEYYSDDNIWKIYADDSLVFSYELSNVILPVIEYFVLEDKKELEDSEILKWFENDVFPTERFGKKLLEWIGIIFKKLDNLEEVEKLFKDEDSKYVLDFEDQQIIVQEKEQQKAEEEELKRVESVFRGLDRSRQESLFKAFTDYSDWAIEKLGTKDQSVVRQAFWNVYIKGKGG